MTGLLLLLLIGLAWFIALTTWWTAHRLRHPPRRTDAYALARSVPANPGEMPVPIDYQQRTITINDPNGAPYEAPIWDIAGEDSNGPVLIASPGWGDSKMGLLPRLATLLPVCSRVIAWDPPGLGEGPGLCALGTREPALLLQLARVIRSESDRPQPIVLQGWSMGAGVAIAAGALAKPEDHIAAVIAESPYRKSWTPARHVMRNAGYPYRVNVPLCFTALGLRLGVGARWRRFDRATLAKRLQSPLLVIHGSDDDVCPIEDGRGIDRAANRSLLVVIEQGGHNNLWTDDRFKPQAASATRDFILSLSAPSGPAPAASHPVSTGQG